MRSSATIASVALHLASLVVAQADRWGIRAANAAPAPTPAPGHLNVHRALFKARALTADNTETCGFANGDADSPFTCDIGSVCAKNSFDEVGGCCPGNLPLSDCYIQTQCYDYTVWRTMTRSLGLYEGACEDIFYPACVGFVSSTDTYLACGSSRTIVSMYDVATFTSEDIVSRSASGTVLPEFSSGASVGTLGADVPTATTANSNGNSDASGATPSSVANNASSTSSKKNKLSTGAIVGIAVAAAVVAVAALVGAGFCFWSRQRQRRRTEEARMSQAASGISGYPPTNGGTSTVGGTTVNAGVPPFQGGQQQQQQQQPPQQQYQTSQMSQHGPVTMSMPPEHFMPAKQDQGHGSNATGSVAGSGLAAPKAEHGGSNVTEIPDDPSDVIMPYDAVDERYRPSRGMSDAGTASVLPSHGHNPPHI